jgi:predicted nucleic acid-binding protein
MNAVDTNVLVYAVDAHESEKQARAIEFLSSLAVAAVPVVIPWQVSVEFLACLRRWESLQRITREQTTAYLELFEETYEVVMPKQGVLSLSLDLSSRYSLSHWDSLLVAACIEASITTLYTEDLANGAKYDSISIVNPFAR